MSLPEQDPKTAPVSVTEAEAPTVVRSGSSAPADETTWVSGSSREAGGISIPTPGQTLAGRYMVFEQLGQGGMGVVLAAYDTRLDRRVALKLLRSHESSEPSSSDGEARLVREAQAMARLNHPHVVAVYDAGTLEDGSLFLAMEYVEGQTLRQWREQQPRSWREVLEAYLAAGKGLAAAHAAGLIHRDFKPDNVLVGKDGRIRVTDFGLARAASGASASEPLPAAVPADSLSSALTVPGTLMGTPKYMAPELMRGEPAGIPSDLFAFCVALYEALYEQLPFPAENMAEYSRARREGRILPPPTTCEVPAWVGRTVLPGLQADPAKRPASMESLLAAMRDDPELKRQGRRRAMARALVGVVLVALPLGVWTRQHFQQPPCSQVVHRLDGIWDAKVKAQVHAALLDTGVSYASDTADRVSTVLDGYSAQWVKQSTALCEEEQSKHLPRLAALQEACLERRRSRLHATTELLARGADQKLLEKAAQATQSLPPLADCADGAALTSSVLLPEEPAVRAQVESLLGEVDKVEALEAGGQYKEALATAEKLLPRVEAVGHEPLHAQLLFVLARLKEDTGDYKGAEELARQTLSVAGRGRAPLLLSRALSLLLLEVGPRQERYAEAAPLVPAVQALAESTGDELAQATAFTNLGLLFVHQGKYPEAWENQSKALALRQKFLAPDHPEVATSLFNLAMVDWWMGRYDAALERTERAAALKQKALGPGHPETLKMIGNTAGMLYEVGRYQESLQHYEQALQAELKILGPEHPTVLTTEDNISIVLVALGRFEEGRQSAEHVLSVKQRLLGPDDPDLASALTNLGGALFELGRYQEALEKQERAHALREKALGPDHALVSDSLRAEALSLTFLKRYREAHERIDRAISIAEKALGAEHPDLAYPLVIQGELLLAQGRPAEALAPLERAQKLAPEGGIRAEVQFTLARALWEASSAERPHAVQLAKQARDYWQHLGNLPRMNRSAEWLEIHPEP